MTTYVINSGVKLPVRVDYADLAGGYGGWFLLNVDGDDLRTEDGSGTYPTPSSVSELSTVMGYSITQYGGGVGTAAIGTAAISAGNQRYRQRFLDLVHTRLEHMFGVGHSAAWTATLVQSVTPAVIDDSF